MKQLVGQVTHKYPSNDLVVWFEQEKFGATYFCKENRNHNLDAGDWVLCEFDDPSKLGTVNRLKQV